MIHLPPSSISTAQSYTITFAAGSSKVNTDGIKGAVARGRLAKAELDLVRELVVALLLCCFVALLCLLFFLTSSSSYFFFFFLLLSLQVLHQVRIKVGTVRWMHWPSTGMICLGEYIHECNP